MLIPGRLVTAEIDLGLYGKNYRSVRSLLSSKTKLMAVVKGNAYGHGIVRIAKKAEQLGADYLGVICLFEARLIREAGIKLPILLLNYTDEQSLDEALELDLSVNVMDDDILQALSKKAKQKRKTATVHVKIDTGMHRLGVLPKDAVAFVSKVAKAEHSRLEGVFTHFADADNEDLTFTYEQLTVFTEVIAKLSKLGIHPPMIHAANSAATLRIPESHFTMVRPGKILFGPLPNASYTLPFVSESILTLKTKIVQIRRIGRGESVGYGRSFIAKKDMVIAALPIGYADGFRRSPNYGDVLVNGTRAPLVGRVSMDQSSVDITHIPGTEVGDEVILIGKQGSKEITTEEIADRIGTINYEVLTSLAERVQRVYKE
ncbi:MAG: alanine racemase [bacterium]|nr:alanine racemase [bacterium]